ncbi:MAG: hypothetical protein ACMZ64_07630 [Oleiphilus sp.]
MAKIPLAPELGQATRTLRQGVSMAPGQTQGFDAIGRLANLGADFLVDIGKNERKVEQQSAFVDSTKELQEFLFEQKHGNTDFETHFDSYSERVKSIEDGVKARFKNNPDMFDAWKRDFSQVVFDKGIDVRERTEQGRLAKSILASDNNLYKLINSAALGDDEDFIKTAEEVNNTIESNFESGIYTQKERAQRLRESSEQLSEMAARKSMMDDPVNTLKRLEKGDFEGLTGDQRILLMERAQREIIQNENRVAIQEKKRSAAAEKALDEMQKQNATGVPPSEETLDKWFVAVEDTPFEQEYVGLLANQRIIQNVLRMPISEQMQFVDEREAMLNTQGGDAKEIANFNTLKNAVDRNVKQMQNEPLTFYQARSGLSVPPIEIEMLLDPAGQVQLKDQLDDRLIILNAMQKEFGPEVLYKPLLPQESQAFAALLKDATPKMQAQAFTAVREVFNDDRAYMAAMQQIAPDAPVKAMAGILMAKQKSLKIEDNWIMDDVMVSSGDVAETLLLGESMLNKTPDQKSKDGSPSNYPIPDVSKFKLKFQSLVGKAFAGRPDAYQLAMQAVRAYYVGVSAKEGDLSDVINNDRAEHSVKAVLGQIVDVNGENVFAPWGMDASSFQDEALKAFENEMTVLGMDNFKDKFHRVLLKNRSETSYYVMNGKNYLLDNSGNPVVIKIQGGNDVGL